jgi:hypothetical protein
MGTCDSRARAASFPKRLAPHDIIILLHSDFAQVPICKHITSNVVLHIYTLANVSMSFVINIKNPTRFDRVEGCAIGCTNINAVVDLILIPIHSRSEDACDNIRILVRGVADGPHLGIARSRQQDGRTENR